MSEFLAGVVVGLVLGVVSTVVGRPLLGVVRARYTRSRQDRKDEQVLRAFRELSADRDWDVPVGVHEVREIADVRRLDEVLERLQHKGHIIRHPDRWDWFTVTDEGLRAASEPRAWRQRPSDDG